MGVQGESICRQALTEATADKDLDALNLNLQKASEMGLRGAEVDRAKALQKELLVSHASLKALRYIVMMLLISASKCVSSLCWRLRANDGFWRRFTARGMVLVRTSSGEG